ncbi:MAG: Response regulator containing a CheY-like receiver domain and a domain protein [Bacteroidota bacterium]|nr:Response regulator containing a CheY-like receiver domain and a domain protein [Bacteroidota bacterium]
MNMIKEVTFLPKRKSIETKKEEIILLEGSVSTKTEELNESIIYAKRIQEGMMLKEKHLARLFDDSFILFKPKDIVSGDFYWFTKIDSKIIVAAADCTGHGIPGAFMSVLGISLLNQIVIEEKNTNVSSILQRLDHKINKAFGYSNELFEESKNLNDGMDIGLCCIDPELMEVSFAGAFRTLYHVSRNILDRIDGSRYPIGGLKLENNREYKKSVRTYEPGDKLYLFTDGYADQFGGRNNKKFMTANFRDTLLKTSRFSMQTQKLELERIINEWKNNFEQTDDMLVVGIKL